MNDSNTKDLAEPRRLKLLNLLKEHRILRVEDFVRALDVSAATVRRDLAYLESSNDLRRIHGGATIADNNEVEPLFDDKTNIAVREKRAIAAAALRLIHPQGVIYLDGGSTMLELARLLISYHQLTVVTNSLRVVEIFKGNGPKMIITGGECRRLSQTFVGPLTRGVLDRIHVDLAFMGTIGVSFAHGLTTTDSAEAFTKEQVIKAATRTILLADSTKFQRTSYVKFAAANQLSIIISDKNMPSEEQEAFKREGCELLLT
ncbi:MAG: DeoR/GlpR family DNA-binding transcription regulator [Kiritimatiellia bacterium]